MRLWLIAISMLGLIGCGGGAAAPDGSADRPLRMTEYGGGGEDRGEGPGRMVIQLEIYQISVPFGTISGNEAFWKRADEQLVDAATYDRLYRNGIRVGRAPTSEWAHFTDILEENPAETRPRTMMATGPRQAELMMRENMRSQNLFYFDRENELEGRTFGRSENLFSLSFEPAPRRPQTLRVSICPVVRDERTRMEFTAIHREVEVDYVRTERLYDLNLVADLPLGQFLIMAPSSEGRGAMSIGNAFLTGDGESERMEQVLLLLPRAFQIED